MFKLNAIIMATLVLSSGALAESTDSCVINKMKASNESKSYKEWTTQCESMGNNILLNNEGTATFSSGLMSSRYLKENSIKHDDYSITPHQRNYFLPVYTTSEINKAPYRFLDKAINNVSDNLEDIEAKFQISFKIPLSAKPLFVRYDKLYAAFTMEAWWQIHSNGISKPFRETNYKPELFYVAPLPWHPASGNTAFSLGLEHQSNGQSSQLSRSWNRAYSAFLYENKGLAFELRTWYRLPEEQKKHENSDKGDDNPDIEKYMGNFEIKTGYLLGNHEIELSARNNLNSHLGNIKAEYTFPLWGKIHGYVSASHGYGDSLIDYNHEQTRFGLGFAFNRLF